MNLTLPNPSLSSESPRPPQRVPADPCSPVDDEACSAARQHKAVMMNYIYIYIRKTLSDVEGKQVVRKVAKWPYWFSFESIVVRAVSAPNATRPTTRYHTTICVDPTPICSLN